MRAKIFNTIENIAIAIITLVVLNFFIVRPLRNDIKEISIKLVEQPTYSIQNDFEKMRTKKGGNITLDLQNELNHIEVTQDSTTATNTDKGFLKRIFKNKK